MTIPNWLYPQQCGASLYHWESPPKSKISPTLTENWPPCSHNWKSNVLKMKVKKCIWVFILKKPSSWHPYLEAPKITNRQGRISYYLHCVENCWALKGYSTKLNASLKYETDVRRCKDLFHYCFKLTYRYNELNLLRLLTLSGSWRWKA